jgi:hypothetical protein
LEEALVNKVLFGLLLGGFLGIFDGATAYFSAPELRGEIFGIILGSSFKGLIAGVLIGWFAHKVHSLSLGVLFGLGIGLGLALPIAIMNSNAYQTNYYWHIMLPGGLMGLLVGYATQRWRARAA